MYETNRLNLDLHRLMPAQSPADQRHMRKDFNFQGLDQVDWRHLEHAYGAADDIPSLLRALASGDTEIDVFEKLFTGLYHQGSVYSAIPKALPFLLQLLGDGQQSSLIHFFEAVSESVGEEPCGSEEVADEIREELGKGMSVFTRLLVSGAPEERAAAARTLGTLSGRAAEAAIAVRARLADEREPDVRAALAEAIARLGGEYAPPEDATPIERFRSACAVAQKKGGKCQDETVAEIVRHWKTVALQMEANAETMVRIGKQFDDERQLEFLCSLLPGAASEDDALTIARQILSVAFVDKRPEWGARGITNNYFVDGKLWEPNHTGSPFPGVTVEQALAFQERFVKAKTVEETKEILRELHSMESRPPVGAVRRMSCEYSNVRGANPSWTLPLASAQTRAIAAIANSDLAWACDTNLWSLFGLPSDREQFKRLLEP
jgi:hypothetical protein